jgi:hypothetical protein
MTANIPPIGSSEPERKRGSGLVEKLATPKVVIGGLISIAALWFIIANNSRSGSTCGSPGSAHGCGWCCCSPSSPEP